MNAVCIIDVGDHPFSCRWPTDDNTANNDCQNGVGVFVGRVCRDTRHQKSWANPIGQPTILRGMHGVFPETLIVYIV